jgi:hypothetical protein
MVRRACFGFGLGALALVALVCTTTAVSASAASRPRQVATGLGSPPGAPLAPQGGWKPSFADAIHGAREMAPKVTRLTATPDALGASGGTIHVQAAVQNATACTFSSPDKVAGLPRTRRCAAGGVTIELVMARNTGPSAHMFRIRLTATRRHGPTAAGSVIVVQKRATHSGPAAPIPTKPASQTALPVGVQSSNSDVVAPVAVTASAPLVTAQPVGETVLSGDDATFTTEASGSPAPLVQWQASADGGSTWTDVPGANSTSLTLLASTSNDGYEYRATVTNAAGSVTTDPVTLTVETTPTVTTQPDSESVYADTGVTLAAAASGSPLPSVQWQFSTDGGTSWTDVLGATSPSYSFTADSTENGHRYRAVFTNAAGSATSNAVALSVSVLDAAPVVTTEPANLGVQAGGTATFTVAATANPAADVQWQLSTDGGGTWGTVSGATSASYVFVATAGQNAYEYRAVFTNIAGSATTSPATLTVASANTAPAVTAQPSGQTVVSGANATFTAAASGNPAPTVQWQVSTDGGNTWTNASGATSTSYTFAATTGQSGNQYRAIFTNAAGNATTTAATLTVDTAPAITTQPTSLTANSGSSAAFTAAASGNPAPTVQWQVSTDGGNTWTNASGATSTSYTFAATTGQSGNQYRAIFTNAAGNATTSTATLTVDTAPAVTTQPSGQTVVSGANATFTAAASGNPAPTVQWQVSTDGGNTWTNASGATSTSYTFTATAGQNGDQYHTVFTNAAGTATTSAATLTVDAAPAVTAQPSAQMAASGNNVTFSAAASGNPVPTVQWQVSTDGGNTWNNASGATSTSYTFSATIGESGNQYRAVFTNTAGNATTSPATLTVGTPPSIGTQPSAQSVSSGSSATFSASASASPTPTVQWQVSTDGGSTWNNASGATSTGYTFTATASQSGNQYRAVFTNFAGSTASAPATLTVSIPEANSNPWAGYAVTGETFSAVSGSWTVPTVTCAAGATTATAQWVGIDGFSDNTVEQDGTAANCSSGTPTYSAWYEMYGDSNVNGGLQVYLSSSSYPVAAGDAMTASVSVAGSEWTLVVGDATQNWSFNLSVPGPSTAPSESSAEWIAERPAGYTLSEFGTVTFTGASAVGNGQSGAIWAFPSTSINMFNNSLLAASGPLSAGGNGFTVTDDS